MGAKHFEEFEPERLVKSTERVRDLGEVFTPAVIVDDMLDMLPSDMWQVHPARTFLEPSVGNGNFVSAILSRKLTFVDDSLRAETLPAGKSHDAAQFHALQALSSIYGVDISEDNIIGGTPGHEIACRPRLLQIMERWFERVMSHLDKSDFMKTAQWIVEHNMVIGNMLEKDALGRPTNRNEILFIEYKWDPESLEVNVSSSTLGDILFEAEEAQADVLSLFGPMAATPIWQGRYQKLGEQTSKAQVKLTGAPMSNTKGKD